MNRAHVIAAIRKGDLRSITRTEWHEVADALDARAEPGDAGMVDARKRLATAEQRCAELVARIQRAEAALRGDPA